MKKIILLNVILIATLLKGYCQNRIATAQSDNFIAVQVNALVRQVFSTSTALSTGNPYLLNYFHNDRKSGWGFRVGIGYNNSVNTSNGINISSTNKTYGLPLRAGIERAWKLSKKLTTGAGIDAVIEYSYVNTIDNNYTGGDTVINNNKNLTMKYGVGAMGWLRFAITERLILGTESSFYYTAGTSQQTLDYYHLVGNPSSPSGNSLVLTEKKSTNPVSNGSFQSPVVFFLMIKF